MAQAALDASQWRAADEAQWRAFWDAEIAGLPSHRESRFWLVAGLLLPIWDRLPNESMRVRRLVTDDGQHLIGRVLGPAEATDFRAAFGLDGGSGLTVAEVHDEIMVRGASFPLANGWRLARRRLMGADRIEIEGPADGDTDALKRMGCMAEIVSWRTRLASAQEPFAGSPRASSRSSASTHSTSTSARPQLSIGLSPAAAPRDLVFASGKAGSGTTAVPRAAPAASADPLRMWDDNRNGRITCKEARRHGIAPVPRGHPAYPYMFDRDGDGVVCE